MVEHPGFRLVDNLFVASRSAARIVGCAPDQVVPTLARVLKKGPKALQVSDGGPCHDRVLAGDDVDLAVLPVVRHVPSSSDPYPYTTSFAVHRDPETGLQNAMFPLRRARPARDGHVVRDADG